MDELIKEDDNPYSMVDKLNSLFRSPAFEEFANKAATKMVTNMNKNSYANWRIAAQKNSKGIQVYNTVNKELQSPMGGFLNELIIRNSTIIKSIPQDMTKKMNVYIQKETLKGTRSTEIAKTLQRQFTEKSRASIKLIARTEVSKTQSALTQIRAENLGIQWYIWRTAEDQRVRSSHEHMEDVLIEWKNPPSPEALRGESNTFGNYHAGEIFNCRCYPEPVVDIDMVSFPHKAHINGAIKMISRKQFEELNK